MRRGRTGCGADDAGETLPTLFAVIIACPELDNGVIAGFVVAVEPVDWLG